MMLKSKIIKKNTELYKYVSRLKDIIEVNVDVNEDGIDTYDIIRFNEKNDDFQLMNNIEILLPKIEDKLLNLNKSSSLIVYIEDFNDKYLFSADVLN